MLKNGAIILATLFFLSVYLPSRAQEESGAPSPSSEESTPARPGTAEDLPARSASSNAIDPYKLGLGWHPAALRDFPKDKYGLVDWVELLNQKLIDPRGSIDPDAIEVPPFNLEIVMPAKVGTMEGAHFPHSTHTTWIACESCHVKIFIPQIGANDLTMVRIVNGESCGVCHGKVSFPLNHCDRCHVPKPEDRAGSPTGFK